MQTKLRSIVLCGHMKCATRWLAEVVRSNPHLKCVGWREVTPENVARLRGEAASGSIPLFIDFPHAIQSNDSLNLLRAIDPDMGAVIIYREPVDALLSRHNYTRPAYGRIRSAELSTEAFHEEFIHDQKFVESALHGQLNRVYKSEYQYDSNALRLRSHFLRFREFTYDHLKTDPEGFLAALFEFCGVPPTYKRPSYLVNRGLAYRSYFLHKLTMKAVYMLTGQHTKQFVRAFADNRLAPSLLRFAMRMNDKNSKFLSEADSHRLSKMMTPMVAALSEITDLDLTVWGYGSRERSHNGPKSVPQNRSSKNASTLGTE